MEHVFLSGLLFGLAYVAPLGMQNVYVINNGINLSKRRAYLAAFIVAFFDIILALGCFFGIGALLTRFDLLRIVFLLVGSLVMAFIGIKLVFTKKEIEYGDYKKQTVLGIFFTAMIVTWFNPQAVIDGSLILGSFRSTLNINESYSFIYGVSLASISWFIVVTSIVSTLKKVINNKVIKVINIVCGLILIVFSVKFLIEVFEHLF